MSFESPTLQATTAALRGGCLRPEMALEGPLSFTLRTRNIRPVIANAGPTIVVFWTPNTATVLTGNRLCKLPDT